MPRERLSAAIPRPPFRRLWPPCCIASGWSSSRLPARPTIFEFRGALLLARPLQRGVGRNCTTVGRAPHPCAARRRSRALLRGDNDVEPGATVVPGLLHLGRARPPAARSQE